jgi:hypothetical protein
MVLGAAGSLLRIAEFSNSVKGERLKEAGGAQWP